MRWEAGLAPHPIDAALVSGIGHLGPESIAADAVERGISVPTDSSQPSSDANGPRAKGAPPRKLYTRDSYMAERAANEPLNPALRAPLSPALTAKYPELYLLGIRHFNHFEMFDCHELLEAVWNDAVDTERQFVQGVIQIAVAILHWESKHKPGALSVFRTGRALLAGVPSPFMGVEVADWLAKIDALFAPVLNAAGDELPELDYKQIPMIAVEGAEP